MVSYLHSHDDKDVVMARKPKTITSNSLDEAGARPEEVTSPRPVATLRLISSYPLTDPQSGIKFIEGVNTPVHVLTNWMKAQLHAKLLIEV